MLVLAPLGLVTLPVLIPAMVRMRDAEERARQALVYDQHGIEQIYITFSRSSAEDNSAITTKIQTTTPDITEVQDIPINSDGLVTVPLDRYGATQESITLAKGEAKTFEALHPKGDPRRITFRDHGGSGERRLVTERMRKAEYKRKKKLADRAAKGLPPAPYNVAMDFQGNH